MVQCAKSTRVFTDAFADHRAVIEHLESQSDLIRAIASDMYQALRDGKKVLWCGNGGSAADSQHLAAELVGRFRRERRAIASVALTTDTSILTAIGNDYGYDSVFSRQVEALGVPGDILVGISTSGNSPNVCKAMQLARELGLKTVSMTGRGGGKLAEIADYALCVDSKDTARIQEAHILAGHILCDWIELTFIEQ